MIEKIEWYVKDERGFAYPIGCVFLPTGWVFQTAVLKLKELAREWRKLFPQSKREADFIDWLDTTSIFKKAILMGTPS